MWPYIKDELFARAESVDTHVVPSENRLYIVSWQEHDGSRAAKVQNYARRLSHLHATLPNGQVLQTGHLKT